MLLTSYTGAEAAVADDEDVVLRRRIAGLRARYDEHLWEQLLQDAAAEDALWLGPEDVGAALGERSALISFFLDVRTPGQLPATGALVITQTSATHHVLPLSDRWMEFWGEISAGREDLPPSARVTAALREAVQADPGWRPVSRDAEPLLAADFESYFDAGGVLEGLREAGIDHLCLVPHGALHFHPLHLLGEAGRTLADDWIVSVLPNLNLLVSRRGLPSVRRYRDRDLTAYGLSFDGPNRHGLPPIRRSAAEAEAVARAFGGVAVPEEQATERDVRAALERSRYVHLSTHGRHAAEAPAFQCLYLTPDEASDGRLEAHELLSLDLRGLDLLTLSACETGLGRFDASDNLRGLPGALLLSGASTLVCTLWEVDADVSERFFVELYTRLRADAGHSRRVPGGAGRHARRLPGVPRLGSVLLGRRLGVVRRSHG